MIGRSVWFHLEATTDMSEDDDDSTINIRYYNGSPHYVCSMFQQHN